MKFGEIVLMVGVVLLLCIGFAWNIHVFSLSIDKAAIEIKQRGLKNMIKDELKELKPYWNGTDSSEGKNGD